MSAFGRATVAAVLAPELNPPIPDDLTEDLEIHGLSMTAALATAPSTTVPADPAVSAEGHRTCAWTQSPTAAMTMTAGARRSAARVGARTHVR